MKPNYDLSLPGLSLEGKVTGDSFRHCPKRQ